MATLAQLDVATDPTVTYTQSSNPLVEPLGGLVSIDELMDAFPVEVYHTGSDSRLYKFVSALCGDAGAGILKKQALAMRLKMEGPLLVFRDLDDYYSTVLTFPRIRSELYNYDQASQLLLDTSYDPTNIAVEKQIWDKIHAADSSYQKRVINFMHATRLGNSLEGMTLAALAGSGEDCEVVENYRYLFDQQSDDPLGLEKLGDTTGTAEFIIQPAGIGNTNDDANTDTLNLTGSPTGGTFALQYESAPTEDILVNGSDISGAIYNAIIGISSGDLIQPTDVSVTVVQSTNNCSYTIQFFNPQLDALFLGVNDGLSLTGGTGPGVEIDYPIGDAYYMTQFEYPLASFYEDNYSEIISGHLDSDHPTTATGFWAGNANIAPIVRLSPDVEFNMVRIVDRLRPVGTVMTLKPKRASQITVTSGTAFASSENFSIIRWITGNPSVQWPPVDASQGNFIQGVATSNGVTANVENEATSFAFGTHVLPAIFHTLDSLSAYTDGALLDSQYNSSTFFTNRYNIYKSEHVGMFDKWVTMIFPFLQSVASTDDFTVDLAVPVQPTQLLAQAPYLT